VADVGERETLDTEQPDPAPATKQSRFGATAEVIVLYVVCLFVALALAAICVSATGAGQLQTPVVCHVQMALTGFAGLPFLMAK